MNQKQRRDARQHADDHQRIVERQKREAREQAATPVNSIQIPDRFVELCEPWHGGIRCKLYAVCSTGNLTMGGHRPRGCETDQQHYLAIWRDLAIDVFHCRQAAESYDNDSTQILREFEDYADGIVEQLESEYDLADWGPEP